MMANQFEPVCKCGKTIKVGYVSREGLICWECHNAKIQEERQKFIKRLQEKQKS